MDALRLTLQGTFLSALIFLLSGCYTLKSAYNQLTLLNSKESYQSALARADITEDQKRKLQLAQEVRDFAKQHLTLEPGGNYSEVVWLDRRYVSWTVSASDPWRLKPYEWSFPIVGNVPYLGFFKEKEAQEKEQELMRKGLDTYVRGVSAYSTLGWFEDPLLSSMLNYEDHVLAETLIHELVHTTIWIKNSTDFNERLASYLGRKGAEIFYIHKEGPDSATVKLIQDEAHDEKLFSSFMTAQLVELEKWYKSLEDHDRTQDKKSQRLRQIQIKFEKSIEPQMRSKAWSRFPKLELNNARLVIYRTYFQDFEPFENLWQNLEGDFQAFLSECKKLIKSKNPDEDLQKRIQEFQTPKA